ncbi:DMT family transporter [Naasia sp. SYSU D00948]|uniref:DMT family transporter n=1 Tax=Naasia sp. SYSU D00948 TaxID=2817379 RepID=UPI001B311795|nr:EamA family transporter [Naasia sp. SYSU D00948]
MPPVVLVLLAAVLFGTTGTAQALGAPEVDALSLGSARIVVGGSLLALVAYLTARRAAPVLTVAKHLDRRGSALTVLIGAVGVVAYQPAFFLGTERNGVAVGTLVALGSAPLLTGVLTWGMERRFPGARWGVATAVAVLGLALLGGAGGATGGGVDVLGLLSSLGAGAAYALYAVMSKRLLDAGWRGAGTMGAVFGAAAVVSLALLVVTDTRWLWTASGALTTLWLGVATVTVAYLLFAAGLRHVSAASASTLTLAEPITAALLGLLILHETLAPSSWIGVTAIAAGILILALPPRRPAVVRVAETPTL